MLFILWKMFIFCLTIYFGIGLGFFLCFAFMKYDVKITDTKTGELRHPKGLERLGICFLAGMLWVFGLKGNN